MRLVSSIFLHMNCLTQGSALHDNIPRFVRLRDQLASLKSRLTPGEQVHKQLILQIHGKGKYCRAGDVSYLMYGSVPCLWIYF